MRWTECSIRTWREPNHPLLVRAGFAPIPPSDETTFLRARSEERIARQLRLEQLPPDPAGAGAPEPFHTPNCKTIAELAAFTALPETSLIKSIVMAENDKPLLLLLRGDRQLNERKLRRVEGIRHPRAAKPEEIHSWFGADPGSLGPVGLDGIRIIADKALQGRRNMISGANRNAYHLRDVTPAESFDCEFAALCDTAAETEFLRAAESCQDKDGFAWWPAWFAPFDVVITPVFWADDAQRTAGQQLHDAFAAAGLEPLLDDRDERAGVKFKDADLLGIPFRVTLGKKLAEGRVEIVNRRTRDLTEAPLDDAVSMLRGMIGNGA